MNGSPVDFKMRAALAQLGPAFRLEIIQPLDELYAESLSRAGGADHVHHVRLDVPDFAGTRDHLIALGLPVRLEASFKGSSSERRFLAMYLVPAMTSDSYSRSAPRRPGFRCRSRFTSMRASPRHGAGRPCCITHPMQPWHERRHHVPEALAGNASTPTTSFTGRRFAGRKVSPV